MRYSLPMLVLLAAVVIWGMVGGRVVDWAAGQPVVALSRTTSPSASVEAGESQYGELIFMRVNEDAADGPSAGFRRRHIAGSLVR